MTKQDSPELNDELIGSISDLLTAIGENPLRDGLKQTPTRFLKAFKFLTQGYEKDPVEIINKALFEANYSEMVIVKNIEFYSLCEHHLLPFFGKCHVAYIPDGKIIGLSKIPRLVDAFARRLQVQERLTSQIAESLITHLKPLGVGVVMEASHLCMMMRGVEKQSSFTTTSSLLGDFRNSVTRTEFFNLIK